MELRAIELCALWNNSKRKKEVFTFGREAQVLRVLYSKFWKWRIPGGGATSNTKELEEKAVLAPADQEKEPAGYARVWPEHLWRYGSGHGDLKGLS